MSGEELHPSTEGMPEEYLPLLSNLRRMIRHDQFRVFCLPLQMDVDLPKSQVLFEKLLQLETEVRKKLKASSKGITVLW